jgi:hypothetical protein
MSRYFRQKLSTTESLPRAPAGPLLGQEIARRAPVVSAIRAQDRVVATSCRVVLQVGKSGATDWLVPNTDPDNATQTYPLRDVGRTVAREQFKLTPGCMLSLRALVGLSGQTQILGSAGVPPVPHYYPGGAQGIIRLTSTWDDGGTPVQRVSEVVLPNSGEEFGAAPTNDGGAWAAMRTVRIPLITPQALNTVVRERRWSQPTVVTLQLEYVGGARVHSCVVSEVPHAVAMEASDAADRWTSHVLGSSPSGQAPLIAYPFQRLSELGADGDPRGGSWHLADVANAQARRMGPVLLRWTSYDEDDESVTITEAAPRIAVSTSFVALANASVTSYSVAQEGHGVAAGSYARTRDVSDPAALPNNGVIPIRLRAYCRGSDGSTNSGGVLRLQTSTHEWIDLAITSGAAAGWYSVVGHARVGAGPGDPAVGQLFFRRTTISGGFSVWAVSVEYDRTAEP